MTASQPNTCANLQIRLFLAIRGCKKQPGLQPDVGQFNPFPTGAMALAGCGLGVNSNALPRAVNMSLSQLKLDLGLSTPALPAQIFLWHVSSFPTDSIMLWRVAVCWLWLALGLGSMYIAKCRVLYPVLWTLAEPVEIWLLIKSNSWRRRIPPEFDPGRGW